MARQINKLTAKEVQLAKPKKKAYRISDGAGLSLYVTKTGFKNWHFRFIRPSTKKPTYIGLGSYPTIRLSNAREKRNEYKKLLAEGLDPIVENEKLKIKDKTEKLYTLSYLMQDWLKLEESKGNTSKTLERKKSTLKLYVLPKLGNFPLTEITAPLAITVLKPIEARGHYETLKRAISYLNMLMRFAVNNGIIHSNPTADISEVFIKKKSTPNASVSPQELPGLIKAMLTGESSFLVKQLFLFQLHTMVRPNEAVKAKWVEFDFETKLWTIPAAKMKMRRDHIIPLTPQVIEILQKLKMYNIGNGFIFPSHVASSGHISTETALRMIQKTSYRGKQTAHGLRALASTTLNEQGFNPDMVDKALAHKIKDSTSAVYNRANYLDYRVDMMNWWSNHIEFCEHGDLSMLKGT